MRKYLKWLSWRRIYCVIVKQEGTPESIAKGVAVGLFVAFFMPVGAQVIVALPLAFLFRANKILAVMFTIITNPYTVTFIYPFQCWLGGLMLLSPLDLQVINVQIKGLLNDPSWSALLSLGHELLAPFFMGGFGLAVATSIPGYYITLYAVRHHRKKKLLKKQRLDERKSAGR